MGIFITLEGGEGCGKSTQATLLAQWLREQGQEVVQTREPGGSEGAEEIRTLLVRGAVDRWDAQSETLLLYTARRDHLRRRILPALERGDSVVCDRFYHSTWAYQGVAQGLDRGFIKNLHELALSDLSPRGVRPDLTLIFDLPVEAGLARAKARGEGEDRFEKKGEVFHQQLREAFLAIAREESDICRVIDAVGSIETVFARVEAVVANCLRG